MWIVFQLQTIYLQIYKSTNDTYLSCFSIQVTVHRPATPRLVLDNRAQEVAQIVIRYLDIWEVHILVTFIQEFQIRIILWVMLARFLRNLYQTTKMKS